ncbi:MAG: ATP synthase F1 subunit delta [Planctomycetota bacterium]
MPLTEAKPDALSEIYAKSLYELAESAGGREAVEQVVGELEGVVELAREDGSFGEFLSSRVLKQSDRSKSLRSMFEGKVHDLTLKFLLVLNEKGRLGHLVPIVSSLDETAQRAFGRVEVDVYTADALEGDELERVRQQLNESLGRETVVHPYVDPKMIGGVRMQIGDRLIDASVAAQLRKVRDRLASEGSARLRASMDSTIERDL